MIDLRRLERIELHPKPLLQRLIARLLLTPNYRQPWSPTKIVVEGIERVPSGGGAILVMNHTDRYNYWPFQYALCRDGRGYTATWVKGKYYENAFLGWFMDATNNIPIPSRGYVLTKDFQRAIGRVPTDAEYAALKALTDGAPGAIDERAAIEAGGEAVARLIDSPVADGERWLASFERRFEAMMARVVELNRQALALGLHLLIFPQGTRSIRLTEGHAGAAQIALHLGAAVVPIGCNGSDRCYPGGAPWSRGGTIVYRVGEPLRSDAGGELAPFVPPEPFAPFTRGAERFADRFRGATEVMMRRIDGLLDERYRFAGDTAPDGAPPTGAKRFV